MATGSDQLVGRREELAFLRNRLADARRGLGRVVIVSGPAGIGKTRLVEELLRGQGIAGTDDLAVGWGAALADAGMPPLWPWTRALRTFSEPRAALAAAVAGGVQGELGSADEAAAATFAADTAVIDALESQATHHDTLLILEDLQWADGATFRLLERLAAEIRRLSLLVIVTDRDPAHVRLENLLARAGTEVVRLRPLTSEEAEAHDERAGMVARHWYEAGRGDRAAEWAVRAADASRAAGAYDEAAAYLALVLDASQENPGSSVDLDVDRAELLLDLARSQYLGGRLEECFESCLRAAREGERTGRPEVVARAAIVVQGIGNPVMNQQLASLCRRALALLDANAPEQLRARLEAQLACALFEINDRDQAVSWSAIALRHAAASGDLNAELDAIRARATLMWLPGSDRELLELGQRAVELAGLAGRPLVELLAHVWRLDAAVRLGDLAGGFQELSEMQLLADRTGLPLARWHTLRHTATLSALVGDFEACRRAAREAATIAESWHDESIRGTHLSMMTALCALRGDPSDLPSDWRALADAISDRPAVVQAVIAEALALAGQREEAAAAFHMLIRNVDKLADYNLAALPPLTEMARLFGSPHECRALRAVVSATFKDAPIAGAGTVWYQGSVARILGELDVGCGEYESAMTHLEEGLAVDTMLGARPYTVRGRLGLARACWATGDLPRTIELARIVVVDARELDMPGPLREAESLLAEARAAAAAADPLTPREREVAELVGQALSNRDVARRLVLSERTVESHVRNILTKTGLRSRTELTRWLLQNRAGAS